MRASRLCVALGFILMGAVVACDEPPRAPPAVAKPPSAREVVAEPLKPQTEPVAPASTCPPVAKITPTGARVLVDISASLRGFAGKKRLENFHRALEAALADVGARAPLERCVVGTKVDCLKAPGLVAAYDEPRLYGASDGRLDLALARPPLVAGCPDKANPDSIDARAITIVLSDGIQSTSTLSRTEAGATAPDQACAEGPSPTCVRALLGKRVDDGDALSVVAAWLPFSGTFYPEVAVTNEMWPSVEAHQLELRVDPRFQGRIDFSLKKPRLPLAATGGFEVSGARPLVAIVVGHDAELVHGFVAAWRAEAMKLSVVSEGLFESVDVAPLPPIVAHIARIERLPSPGADGVLPGRAARVGDGFEQNLACEETGAAELRAVLDAPFVDVIGPVKRTLTLAPLGPSLPSGPGGIASPFAAEASPPASFKMNLACRQLRGTVKPMFALTSTASASDSPTWWSRYASGHSVGMAAPSSWGFPERIHGLDELVTALVQQQAKTPAIVDKLTLVVERR